MIYQITSGPDAEVLTASDLIPEVRARTGEDETPIDRKIIAARKIVEEELRMALITQTVEVFLDTPDAYSPITLPIQPVQSITSLTTYDESGNATAVSSASYRLSGSEGNLTYVMPGRVMAVGGGWSPGRYDAGLRVIYEAGFGDAAANVPSDIKEAVYRIAYYLWRTREDQIVGTTRIAAIRKASDILHTWRPVVAA